MIIIAPHPDDELIGCYSLLTQGGVSDVYYLLDGLSDERKKEAINLCKYFGIGCLFLSYIDMFEMVHKQENTTFFVPSMQDHHPDHKRINAIVRNSSNKGIYSIDMNTEFISVLSEQASAKKKYLLDRFYPSQAELWNKNSMYYLFEGTVLTI